MAGTDTDRLAAELAAIRERLAQRDALMEQAMTARRVPQTAIATNRDDLVADVPRLLAAVEAVLAVADRLDDRFLHAEWNVASILSEAAEDIRDGVTRALLGAGGTDGN